jgi:hypothetical protein
LTVLTDRNSACEISSLVMCEGRKHSTARSLSVSRTSAAPLTLASREPWVSKRSSTRPANPAYRLVGGTSTVIAERTAAPPSRKTR